MSNGERKKIYEELLQDFNISLNEDNSQNNDASYSNISLNTTYLTEKAGARFVEGTKEYALGQIVAQDVTNIYQNIDEYRLPIATRKQLLQKYGKEGMFEDDVVFFKKYEKQNYPDEFPDWFNSLYVLIYKGITTGAAGYYRQKTKDNSNILPDGRFDKLIIGINLITKTESLDTILHEIRHGYTDYIRIKKKEEYVNWRNKEFSLGKLEEIVYGIFIQKPLYDKMKKLESFYDWKSQDTKDPYVNLANSWMYYLQETEMNSHTEGNIRKVTDYIKKHPYACICSPEDIFTRVNIEPYFILKRLSVLVNDDNEMKKWSTVNSGIVGQLGLKLRMNGKNIPKDAVQDEMDAKVWVLYKIKKLRKMVGQILTHVDSIKDEIRKEKYTASVELKRGRNIIYTIELTTNIPTLYLFVCMMNYIKMKIYYSYSYDIITSTKIALGDKTFQCEWFSYDRHPIDKQIENLGNKFGKSLYEKKNIQNIDDLFNILDKVVDKFNNKILIK